MPSAQKKGGQEIVKERVRAKEVMVWVLALVGAAGLLALLASFPLGGTPRVMGKAVQEQGTWMVTEANGTQRMGRVGLSARDGGRIETLGAAEARLKLSDGSALVVDGETVVTIGTEGDKRKDVKIELTKGRLLLATKPGERGYVVKAPGVQLGATEAMETQVRMSPMGVEIMVITGKVEVTPVGGGKSVTLQGGEVAHLAGTTVTTEKLSWAGMMEQLAWSTAMGVELPENAPTGPGGALKMKE